MTTTYAQAGAAADAILAEYGLTPNDILSLDLMDPEHIKIHTWVAVPDVPYVEQVYETDFVHRAIVVSDGHEIEFVYISPGKVVPA